MNQSIKNARITQIMRGIAKSRLPGGVKYFVGKEQISGPGAGVTQPRTSHVDNRQSNATKPKMYAGVFPLTKIQRAWQLKIRAMITKIRSNK